MIPKYGTEGAAGFDFLSIENVEIYPNTTVLIKTGLSFEIPEGYEMQIRPRSGLSLKTNLRIANSPGTVDSDFRGEICIIMNNISSGDENFPTRIKQGNRIAQGVICPVPHIQFEEVDLLTDTNRGEGGYGSTGL